MDCITLTFNHFVTNKYALFNLFLCNVLSYLRDRCSVSSTHNIPPRNMYRDMATSITSLFKKKNTSFDVFFFIFMSSRNPYGLIPIPLTLRSLTNIHCL